MTRAAVALVALLAALAAWTAGTSEAQEVRLQGDLDIEAGVALAVWSGGHAEEVLDEARAQGCNVVSFWATRAGGGLVGYFPTQVQVVNQAFLGAYAGGNVPAGTPVLVVCRPGGSPPPAPIATPRPTATATPTPTPTPAAPTTTAPPPPMVDPWDAYAAAECAKYTEGYLTAVAAGAAPFYLAWLKSKIDEWC